MNINIETVKTTQNAKNILGFNFEDVEEGIVGTAKQLEKLELIGK